MFVVPARTATRMVKIRRTSHSDCRAPVGELKKVVFRSAHIDRVQC